MGRELLFFIMSSVVLFAFKNYVHILKIKLKREKIMVIPKYITENDRRLLYEN